MDQDSHVIEACLSCLGGQRRSTERKEYQYGFTPLHPSPFEAARKQRKYGHLRAEKP